MNVTSLRTKFTSGTTTSTGTGGTGTSTSTSTSTSGTCHVILPGMRVRSYDPPRTTVPTTYSVQVLVHQTKNSFQVVLCF